MATRPPARVSASVTPAAVDEASQALLVVLDGVRERAQTVLSASQLRALQAVERDEGLNLGALADSLGMLLSSASRLADRLVATGMIERMTGTARPAGGVAAPHGIRPQGAGRPSHRPPSPPGAGAVRHGAGGSGRAAARAARVRPRCQQTRHRRDLGLTRRLGYLHNDNYSDYRVRCRCGPVPDATAYTPGCRERDQTTMHSKQWIGHEDLTVRDIRPGHDA